MTIYDKYFRLLQAWGDRLVSMQNKRKRDPQYLKGAIICPACKMIHGRIADSIYPLIFLYDKTGNLKYLHSAELLFDWSKNMLTDDGSYYNDAQNDWNGITVFFVSMLGRTLIYHYDVLPEALRKKFEERLLINIGWILKNIDDNYEANINYHAAAAEAMALCWKYFGKEEYKRVAEKRMEFCIPFINRELFITGESHPLHYHSSRGLAGVDISYNLEETLPALYECASILDVEWIKSRIQESARIHRRFILPDGGMDNSFGSRNYKWTYWGSRTSDGYLAMFEKMGKEDTSFLPYKYYAYRIFKQCTSDGLLYGGMDLKKHGEYPCIHHTFCKAKAVATFLDNDITECAFSTKISEKDGIYHYKTLLSDQIFYKGFYALITSNDVQYLPGGHISGGMIGFLWHEDVGPIMTASMMKYSLHEVTNSQLSLTKSDFEKQSFRYEMQVNNMLYSSDLDFTSSFRTEKEKDKINVYVNGVLRNLNGDIAEENYGYEFMYTFQYKKLLITCQTESGGLLHIPVIADLAEQTGRDEYSFTGKNGGIICIKTKERIKKINKIFNLVCGFYMYDIVIEPTGNKSCVFIGINDYAEE